MRALLLLSAISATESFTSQAPPAISVIAPHAPRTPIHLSAYRDDATSSSGPPLARPTNTNNALAKKPPPSLPNGGRITLLGAGPGDPDLLTLKAYRLLSDETNLVIVDRLVSDEILDIVKGEVKRANKYPGCAEQVRSILFVLYLQFFLISGDVYPRIYLTTCVLLFE